MLALEPVARHEMRPKAPPRRNRLSLATLRLVGHPDRIPSFGRIQVNLGSPATSIRGPTHSRAVRVVITGGAGFIGSNLAHYWHTTYPTDSLVVFDALTYAGHRESLVDLEQAKAVEFVQGDILDTSLTRSVVRGADLVLHLAAETHNDRAIDSPMPFVRTNVVGTASLLEAARGVDLPRLHHVSTDEVFGSLSLADNHRFTTDSVYHPRSPYAASKAAADHLVRGWAETYGMKVTVSNCGNNFGPFQHPEKLIPLAITRFLRDEPVPVYGEGRNVRDWIYVEDHCEALDLIAHQGQPGATYLVSASAERSNNEVVARLAGILGKGTELIRHVQDRPGHDMRYSLDPSKLQDELGWRPRTSFDEGIRRTVAWYRANEWWWGSHVSSVTPSGG